MFKEFMYAFAALLVVVIPIALVYGCIVLSERMKLLHMLRRRLRR